MSSRQAPTWLNLALLGVVALRVAGVVFAAIATTRGDYYASLPGAYVRTLNPVLWDSPDLQGAMGYHRDTYFHGPVQYLTLYPLAFLDSYQEIAWALLPIYAAVLGGAFWCLRAALGILAPKTPLTVPLAASTFLFFPLLQSYIQREFEIVIFLGLCCALWLLLRDRRSAAAAVLAYVAWFKYIPLLFGAYLVLRGWLKATAVFVLASLVVLGAAHALFGLPQFVNNNVPGHAAQVLRVWDYGFHTDAAGELAGEGFCEGWFESETTLANIRHGLCAIGARAPWFPATIVYLFLCSLIAAIFLVLQRRLANLGRSSDGAERWRRAFEFSIVTTVCACFFFSHYYYLIVLAIPLNVLLARYLSRGDRVSLGLWGVAYVLISAFVVPTGILTDAFGTDVWALYIKGGWFLYGELLLVTLLLRELWDAGGVQQAPVAVPDRRAAGGWG